MFRKTVITVLVLVIWCTSLTWASDCNDYIVPGRALMFDGTLPGLRQAYQTFDNGINDPCCTNNRELRFLHAIAGTAMLIIRDDNGSANSMFELAELFGIEVLGDFWAPYFEPNELQLQVARNRYDAYEIPAGAPDANQIRDIIDTNMMPEIETLIADLNSISDSPPFKIFLDPCETRILFHADSAVFNSLSPDYDPNSRFLQPLEVDYGEVLLLKGLLAALKAQLQVRSAYDLCVDANDMLAEKFYGDSFNINADLLQSHPNLLNVLPSACDPHADGKAILAEARRDFNDAISYYLYAIDHIINEDSDPCHPDPQDDELLYIDPNEKELSDTINNRLNTLRASLVNDAPGTYPWQTTKTYYMPDPCSATTTWELTLNYNIIGLAAEEAGSFVASDSKSAPSPWEVEDISFDANEIIIEMDYDVPCQWGGALFTGILSADGNNVTNGTFAYWGFTNGTLTNLSGQLVKTEVLAKQMDLNPVFGSSTRYPDPVNPRDLLPLFDEWNGPQPNTVGHGLGDDATLGGILPDMNQYDWQVLWDLLQPGGMFYLDSVSPGQVIVDGNVTDWSTEQLVLEDIRGDTWEDYNPIQGVDVKNLYIAYDWQNLYYAITLYDDINSSNQYWYELDMSYSPDDDSALHSIRLEISVSGGFASGRLYHKAPHWVDITPLSLKTAAGRNAVEFKVALNDIPADLDGRFISLFAEAHDGTWCNWAGEDNETHLRIADVGTISGTVFYTGYRGAPIFVQAYTDREEPEESIVAGTMILRPGPYTLQGVGLRWQGHVRAFTPLFGFNIFDLEAPTVQDSTSVFLMGTRLDGVDLFLNDPTLLKKDDCVDAEISPAHEEDWYSFYAVEAGAYTLDLIRNTSPYASMSLYGRDGHSEIEELYYWQPQRIDVSHLQTGRYYIKVTDDYRPAIGGSYRICLTSDVNCPQSDIAGLDWAGVEDCMVDFYDYAVLASHWRKSCSDPFWCDHSDFDKSKSVDFSDLALMAKEWLDDWQP